MFIRAKKSPHKKGTISIQIVESVRKADKVSQSIVRHVGTAHTEEEVVELKKVALMIKRRLEEERQPSLPLFSPEDLVNKPKGEDSESLTVDLKKLREEQRFNNGIVDVFGELYKELGFEELFSGQHAKLNNSILKSCVLARLANPSSKLRTSELLENDFSIRLPVEKIYRMMSQLDKIESNRLQDMVRKSSLDLLDQKVDILLYDVTTLYFESFTPDELRNFGFSKDCKFKETQVVLAMVTTKKGLPIAYEIFPGNTMEIKTLIPFITNLKERYNVDDIDMAADRGMFCEANLLEMEKKNIQYVVAAKLKTMSKEMKKKILSINDSNSDDTFRIIELEHKNRRLIITYSPTRAAKDRKDRQRLLERVEKLKGKDGSIPVKKLVNNNGTKKYLTIEKPKEKVATINYDKIEEEEKWDGIAGYVTNSNKTASDIIDRYKSLWEIEESFRINKHDLRVRPIFHRNPKMIKSHLDICFIAYALSRQLTYRYEIQQGERISFNVVRNELLRVQSSLLTDISTKKKYILPSKTTPLASKLYRILALKRSTIPYEVKEM